ncbi:putative mitochondrial peptidyl-tRNA hydrolase AgPth2_1 [Andalucia godoyi]|uniref:peptidyl-tRNA hydrolase n=1 Tax=Andalucia godoyi TaxID=505711 RepID=A0A8K0AGZ7_ANDGO|nr:putative mitochondrial peptidyl-tRNA hydrolase AgPth2_1 [Andalucia godoyi]|eukprot:ANDGO_07382.mRNA.1 putative mitochondrial peptidyl-tRNA hydrolase AgPth2_1
MSEMLLSFANKLPLAIAFGVGVLSASVYFQRAFACRKRVAAEDKDKDEDENGSGDESENDSDDEDSDADAHTLTKGSQKLSERASWDGVSDDLKMVLIVRTDLGMQKGKAAAQCCHACLASYEKAKKICPKTLREWYEYGQPKITLKVDSEEALVQVWAEAKAAGLPCYLVCDAGRTQIAAGSKTVVAIGPAPNAEIDKITGSLKLY